MTDSGKNNKKKQECFYCPGVCVCIVLLADLAFIQFKVVYFETLNQGI